MDESIGRAGRWRTWPTRLSLSESSIYDPPPFICHNRATISYRPCYDIVFCMRFLSYEDLSFTHWYKIKVDVESSPVDDEIPEIRPFWEGDVPFRSSFAAVGDFIYRLGGFVRSISYGLRPSRRGDAAYLNDVYKFCIGRRPQDQDGWFQAPSMLFRRSEPHTFVLDGKIYVVSGHDRKRPGAAGVEVYEPTTGKWKALPDLPSPMGCRSICAALENPSRIFVAFRTDTYPEKCVTSEFYQYDVREDCWKSLDNRKMHFMCPLGDGGGNAVTAGNTLYWLIDNNRTLLAYDVDHNVWLLGSLKAIAGITRPFLFIHLEEQRFCILQHSFDDKFEVQCVIIEVYPNPTNKLLDDVYRNPGDKSLKISVVSVHTYKTQGSARITDCFLL